MSNVNLMLNEVPPSLKRNWGWLCALGIFFVFLGCIGLGMVVGLTLVSVLFLGVLLIIGGLSQMIDVFRSKQWKGAIWHALIAFLYIFAGCIIMYDPILASTIITALLAWVLIFIGITRFIMALVLRHGIGWAWPLVAGLTAFILGVLILLQWPYSGLWVIGLFIAIEMMVNGWTYIFMSLAIRRA